MNVFWYKKLNRTHCSSICMYIFFSSSSKSTIKYIMIIMEKIKIQRKDYVTDQNSPSINNKLVKLNQIHFQQPSSVEQNIYIESTTPSMFLQQRKQQKVKGSKKKQVVVSDCKEKLTKKVQKINQKQSSESILKLKFGNNEQSIKQNEQYKLKKILNSYRHQSLITHFLIQLRRNSVYRKPIDFQPFNNSNNLDFYEGIRLHQSILNIGYIVSSAYTIICCFITTFLVVFNQLYKQRVFQQIQCFGIIILLIQIIMGFVRVRVKGTQNLVKLNQIFKDYLRSNFIIDICCLACLILAITIQNPFQNYLIAVFFLKIPQCFEKLSNVQIKLFDSFYWEQYCKLFKLLLTNFTYAHFIAIFLLMMSWLDQNNSWLKAKGLVNSPFYQQYSWAYYWGTTIMLTVGFGDISATNYKEAICLVLIQTVSCMALAFNINCLGDLIKQLRSKEIQKQKSLKILKKLQLKNELDANLNFKLTNHIKQTYKIQTKLNFKQQSEFISKLPVNLKEEVLRVSNYKLISKLTFIKNLTNKTIQALAQKLETKITHPQQIIFKMNQVNKIVILKQGQVGLFPNFNFNKNKYNSEYLKFAKTVIDKFFVLQGEPAQLVSLDFFRMPTVKNYDIKSITYSKIFQMQIQQMIQILKYKGVDFEHYFSLKHKEKTNMQDFQLIKCQYCNSKHSKFICPRLHYVPIQQKVIHKYLHRYKFEKNNRKQYKRCIQRKINCLKVYRFIQRQILGNFINKQITSLQQSFSGEISNQCEQHSEKRFIISKPNCNLRQKAPSIKNSIQITSNFNLSDLSKYEQINRKNSVMSHQKSYNSISYVKKDGIKNQKCEYLCPNSQKKAGINTKIFKTAAQIMHQQMQFLIKKNKEFSDNFWQVEVDQARNYKFYFIKSNPSNLDYVRLKRASYCYNFNSQLSKQKSMTFKNKYHMRRTAD